MWTGWSKSEAEAEESTNHIANSYSPFVRDLERKTKRPSAILNESEVSDCYSASVASVTSVNQAEMIQCFYVWTNSLNLYYKKYREKCGEYACGYMYWLGLTEHSHKLWQLKMQISPRRSATRNVFFVKRIIKLGVCTEWVQNTHLTSGR